MDLLLALFVPTLLVALLLAERFFPARSLPAVPSWLAKNLVFFVVGAVVGGVTRPRWWR
jgi:hypothetical protein